MFDGNTHSVVSFAKCTTALILTHFLRMRQGNQLQVEFNSQSTIQVGGRWNRGKNRVDKPFMGIMSGLVVNGARIFELAASKNGRVTTKGDVHVMPLGSLADRVTPLQRMQQTPASGSPGVADDLIFSGAGSGCAGDDEDEDCTPVSENTDDLITPVYVAPTKSSLATSRPRTHHGPGAGESGGSLGGGSRGKAGIPCDDEEECNEEGSGSEPGTTEEIFVTSTTDSSSSSISYTTQKQYQSSVTSQHSVGEGVVTTSGSAGGSTSYRHSTSSAHFDESGTSTDSSHTHDNRYFIQIDFINVVLLELI
ncbi:hypothetical protein QAD02_005288 [Eretmocerus hayati]|uniref:Uncharacterized protein n=1 Tax=Eretmocerus hayati TaxID=131215 RepID=A0ACC2NT26_9HYME|nr:hypothetical protein QAD02_005288 [Eretmocerus hayati]